MLFKLIVKQSKIIINNYQILLSVLMILWNFEKINWHEIQLCIFYLKFTKYIFIMTCACRNRIWDHLSPVISRLCQLKHKDKYLMDQNEGWMLSLAPVRYEARRQKLPSWMVANNRSAQKRCGDGQENQGPINDAITIRLTNNSWPKKK